MATLTLPISEDFREQLKSVSWINWSEIAREETLKKLILEKYLKREEISEEEWEFCERVNWHPVDELPLKESFRKELDQRKKGPFIKLNSVDELFKK